MTKDSTCATILLTIYKEKSRVRICALSANRTGSCQLDEKHLRESVLAVQILHPAAAHDREDDKEVKGIPAMQR